VDGGPGLGKQEARQVQQPQIQTERETETGCHRGRFQQTPRLPVPPAKDWPLPHRTIPPVDDQCPDTKCWLCQCNIQTREHLFKNCGASRNPSGQPSWRRPRNSQALLGGGIVPKFAELLADERCSQAVLVFLATTDVGVCASWKGREFGLLDNYHGQNQERIDIRSHFPSIGFSDMDSDVV